MQIEDRLRRCHRADVVMDILDEMMKERRLWPPGGLQQFLLHRLLLQHVQTTHEMSNVRMMLLLRRVYRAEEQVPVESVDVDDAFHATLNAFAECAFQLTFLNGIDLVLRW